MVSCRKPNIGAIDSGGFFACVGFLNGGIDYFCIIGVISTPMPLPSTSMKRMIIGDRLAWNDFLALCGEFNKRVTHAGSNYFPTRGGVKPLKRYYAIILPKGGVFNRGPREEGQMRRIGVASRKVGAGDTAIARHSGRRAISPPLIADR